MLLNKKEIAKVIGKKPATILVNKICRLPIRITHKTVRWPCSWSLDKTMIYTAAHYDLDDAKEQLLNRSPHRFKHTRESDEKTIDLIDQIKEYYELGKTVSD